MRKLLVLFVILTMMFSSCWLFGPKDDNDSILLTFLPDDEEYEYGLLDFHRHTDGGIPEWIRDHEQPGEGVGWSGYHLKPNNDSDDDGFAELTFIKGLGSHFRLNFTFRVYTQQGDVPIISIPSEDGTKRIEISLRDKAGASPFEKEIGMTEYEGETVGETHFVTLTNTDFSNRFALDRWYSLFIDVKNGNEFTVDIDERDGVHSNPGDDPSMDDDIVEFSYTFFTDEVKQSYTFFDPTFKAPWVDESTDTDWFNIGLLEYLDCEGLADEDWPDPHGDDY